jgi:ubiquinone/menaquinone biosynthesis C-methylase UbiE
MKRITSKGVFPYQWAFTLLIPFRNIFLSPKQLIKRLELKEDLHVMELGPGPGYFSLQIAKNLPDGKLVLVDIQQEMLDYARKRIEKKDLSNVEYHLCNGERFDFQDDVFDRIFMVTVIGEVENKDVTMREFHRMLKKDGMLSISEQAGDPDKMTSDEIRHLAEQYGFSFDQFYGSEKNYTINFRK